MLNFSRGALIHMKTRVCLKYFVNGCGFYTGWASFQYGLRNSATYIPFYSSRMSIKMQQTPKKDSILSKRPRKTAYFPNAQKRQHSF